MKPLKKLFSSLVFQFVGDGARMGSAGANSSGGGGGGGAETHWYANFSAETKGGPYPTGWIKIFTDPNSGIRVSSWAASTTGSAVMQVACSGANDYGIFAWTSVTDAADVDVLVRAFYNVGDDVYGNAILVRSVGTSSDLVGYVCNVDHVDDLNVWEFEVGGGSNEISNNFGGPNTKLTLSQGDPYFMRVRASASAVKVRAWTTSLADEPTGWDLDCTVSVVMSAGRTGVACRAGGGGYEQYTFDKFAVAINGATAEFSTPA